jgi:hypothetical protein
MRVSEGYIERVAQQWRSAFQQVNGRKAPKVVWERGWFRIKGVETRYRRTTLEKMTKNLIAFANGEDRA